MSSIKTKRGDTLIEVLLAVAIFSIIAVSAVGIMNHGLNRTQASLETTMARTEIDSQAEALRFIHDSYSNDRSFKKLWHYIAGKVEGDSLGPRLSTNNPDGQYNQDLTSCAPAYNYTEGNSIYNKKAFVINPRKLEESMNEEDGSGVPAALKLSMNGTSPDTTVFQAAPITPRLIYTNGAYEEGGNLYSNSFDGYDEVARAEGIWVIAVESQQKGKYTEDNNIEVPLYYDFYIQTCWDSPGNNTATNLSTTIRLHNPDAIQSPPNTTDLIVTYYSNYPDGINNEVGYWTGPSGSFVSGRCIDGDPICANHLTNPYLHDGSHYVFDGWMMKDGGGNFVPLSETLSGLSSVDAYASWKRAPKICYTYKYDDDGSIFYQNRYNNIRAQLQQIIGQEYCLEVTENSKPVGPEAVLLQSGVNLGILDQTGYVFKGWGVSVNTNDVVKNSDCVVGRDDFINAGLGALRCNNLLRKGEDEIWRGTVFAYWAAKIDTMYGILAYPKVSSWIEVCNTIRVPFIGDRIVCIDELRRKLVDAYGAVGSEYAGFNDGPLFNRMENVNSGQTVKLLYPRADNEVAPFFEEKSNEDENSEDYDTNTFARKHRILKLKINDTSFFGPIKEIFQKAETLGSVTLFRNLNYSNQPYYYSIFSYNYQYGRKINGSEDVWLAVTLKGDGAYKYVSVPKVGPTNYNCWMVSAIRKAGDNRELIMFDNKLTNTDNGMTCAVQKDDALVNSKRAL